ncbi:glycosyltransferase family 39 protein [Undibacterium jejuense]|uniref:Glycosyltransferase family 39 protein n=1 Tax=Undibacterium jejuense TaxID=1344949 RepID=A0A923HN41_9BURK|nr:glycosyltransferase family 39 protein [Undibacterium jejuense]MBC3861668.1 glycosyltransferase family 39 protein [Undibacterium jejuense]
MQVQKTPLFPDMPRWLVWVVAIYFVGFRLGGYAVLDNNEGLYAEISREMLHSGDWAQWIIPHLNGLSYMEKPPLLYWLTAMFFGMFGEAEWVVRLVPALSCLGCVGLILWFARQVNRETAGKFAAIVFVSALGVTAMARTLMFDMLLTVFLTGAVMHAYLYLESRQQSLLYRTMALLAFALLAKGFVSLILFSAIIGSYILISSSSIGDFFQRLGLWFNWRGLLVFFVISAPWHIAAMMTEPIFAWFYFINEHILRFLGKREPHDYYAGAWWYYIPRVLIFLFPWSLLLPSLLFAKGQVLQDKKLHLFLFMAWLMPVLFFSSSSAKANYYLVAVMPVAAMQLAFMVESKIKAASWRMLVPGIVLIAFCSFAIWWLLTASHDSMNGLLIGGIDASNFVLYSLIGLLIAVLVSMVVAFSVTRIGVFAYLLLPVLSLPILLETLTALDDVNSARSTISFLQKNNAASEVYLFHVFEQQSSVPFYLKKPVKIVESHSSDLFWGNKLHKNNIVIDDAEFMKVMTTGTVSLLVVKQDLDEFKQKNYSKQFKLIAQIGNTSIFSN